MSHNCIKPPHFPPHCGCPAGLHKVQPLTTKQVAK